MEVGPHGQARRSRLAPISRRSATHARSSYSSRATRAPPARRRSPPWRRSTTARALSRKATAGVHRGRAGRDHPQRLRRALRARRGRDAAPRNRMRPIRIVLEPLSEEWARRAPSPLPASYTWTRAGGCGAELSCRRSLGVLRRCQRLRANASVMPLTKSAPIRGRSYDEAEAALPGSARTSSEKRACDPSRAGDLLAWAVNTASRGRFVGGRPSTRRGWPLHLHRPRYPEIPTPEPNYVFSGRPQPVPAPTSISIGETGFEPATARPPAREMRVLRVLSPRVCWVLVCLSARELRSLWTPNWTPGSRRRSPR